MKQNILINDKSQGEVLDLCTVRHSGSLQQLSLFTLTLTQFEAELSVSADEMALWYKKEWLSFDPLHLPHYEDKERDEVLFIAGLARSGLSDAMISRLLSQLEKPYCYCPSTTFYSFVDKRWISLPPEPAPSRITDEYIDTLIEDRDWETLHALHEHICEALTNSGAKLDCQ